MDFGKNIQQSFDLYVKNFVTLLLASLVAVLLSVVTIGILAGPLLGGFMVLCLKLLRGEKGEFNEIFAHFGQLVPTLLVTLGLWAVSLVIWVISSVPFVGWIIQLVAGPAMMLVYFLTISLVVDQKMQPMAAVRKSINLFAADLVLLWVYALVTGIIGGIGAIVFGIGMIFTLPFGIVALTLAYQELSGKSVPSFKIEKQMLQIAGIVIGILFIAGLAFSIFGFGRYSSRRAGMGLASKILSSATGQKVKIKDKGDRIQIGGMSFGAGLPDNFPKDIPIYPQAKVEGFLGGSDGKVSGSTTTLTSKASAEDVCDYYVDKLEAQGWDVSTNELGDLKMVNFGKGSRKGGITINPGDSETSILIGITTE